MFGYHGTAVCLEIRYCDASDLFFFFFNYLGSLVLNIKLGYSVKSIIDILVETALNL